MSGGTQSRRAVHVVGRLALRGPRGEPVDLRRTFASHGVASLPPARVHPSAGRMTVTLSAPGGPRTVRLAAGEPRAGAPEAARAWLDITVADRGPPPGEAAAAALTATVRRMLCLDDDLSAFYARAALDPDLSWACAGAGRMLRGASVFEDVVKTICTTNCAWSATERMAGALVDGLGEAAPGDDGDGRAFPSPAAMAAAGDDFYRDVARAGYRGTYLRALAAGVAEGRLDLEALLLTPRRELPDDEVERRLLALPGVGPYAAAHVMMLLGRHSRLILDSWTRPTYARLVGRPTGKLVADKTIGRRFRAYGADAGLAFWLYLTRDWVE